MDTISDSIELTRLVFLAGAVLALLYKKRFGVTPGGIIVPGTLAVVFDINAWYAVMSLAAGALCWLLYRLIFGSYALSARLATAVTVSLSVAVSLVGLALLHRFSPLDQPTVVLSLIGPGLIAISGRKYGLAKAMRGTILTTLATVLIGLGLAAVMPDVLLQSLTNDLSQYRPLILSHPSVVLTVSLLTAVLLHTRLRTRGAGYLISPFIAVVFTSSVIQSLLLALSVCASYLIVRTAQKYSLIIGLDRFLLSLFCGYVAVSLMDILAASTHIAGYRSNSLILIIAIAVLTNDLCLQPLRTFLVKGMTPALAVAYITRLAV